MKYIHTLFLTAVILANCSCKKIINIDPPKNQLTQDKVFNNASSVIAATSNMYTVLNTVDANFIKSSEVYADDFITTTADATTLEFTNSALTSPNTQILSVWQNLYSGIYKANSVIENLQVSAVPDSVKSRSLGEAKFIRAYCHFMLTNIYGDVPLITTTNVTANALATRVPTTVIYAQIINDLKDAIGLIPASYADAALKIRANKWAAVSLLAKVYLYNADYPSSEKEASLIIESGQYNLTGINNVFLSNSNEAILQLWNVNGFTTVNSVVLSGKPPYQISTSLISAFEAGDNRKTNWTKSTIVSGISYNYPYKYKQRTVTTGINAEYTMYLRLGEIYLIRAEARALQNHLTDAAADLNIIRNRAGLSNYLATTQTALLTAIYHERQIELFNEGGNRFFDLKRAGTITGVIGAIKPFWKSTGALYPIPQSERLKNPNLTQNSGYNN